MINIILVYTKTTAEETGKGNSGRADGVLESVGFFPFILAISYLKMALAIVFFHLF